MGLENPIHLAILLMIMLLVFGAKRLPEMGRGLGDGMRSFKDALSSTTPVAQLDGTPAAPEAVEPTVN
jgi:sec-independent protein translocase protein TatA